MGHSIRYLKPNNRFSLKQLFVVFVSCLLVLILTTLRTGAVIAISKEQKKVIDSGILYFDVEEQECNVTSPSVPQNIYVIGDSLTVGMRDQGELSQKLSTANITPSKVEATVGISITDSLARIEADADLVRSSGIVFVALGTNDARGATKEAISQKISSMIDKIKTINPSSKIYWMNTYSSVFDVSATNSAIAEQSSLLNYQLVDWNDEVLSNGGKYSFDSALGVHPTGSGYSDMSDFVTASVSASSQTSAVDTELLGTDNIEKAYRYFLQKGLTPVQSAAIVGNLMQESGVNPLSESPASKGIAQWLISGRWVNLLAFAQSEGRDPLDLGLQLDFMWKELSEGYLSTLNSLKEQTSIPDATIVFEEGYERAGIPMMDRRIGYAEDVFNLYGGVSGSPLPSGDCIASTGTGQDTRYVDGFTIYSQNDPAWKDLPYASSTIGESGCGPSAMAMIITALTGQSVTPVETANYAAERGLYVPGQGSSWNIGPVLAEHWGLNAQAVAADLGAITATLQAGGLIIAPGEGALPFTSGGHFIVIRGITTDGKFKIGDSGHRDTSEQDWDPLPIISNMRPGGVYAITK